MASERSLTEEEIEEYREIFNLVDTDGSGDISKAELGDLCRQVGLSVTSGQLDQMIFEAETMTKKKSDGSIDFDEFLGVVSKASKLAIDAKVVKRAFHVFSDPHDKKYVLVAEVQRALTESSKGSATRTASRIKTLIDVLDPDHTGRVAYEDFVDVMSS